MITKPPLPPFDPAHAQEYLDMVNGCDQEDIKNPRVLAPVQNLSFQPPQNPSRTLAEELGLVVDEARQIAVDLGMRPYRVFAVTVDWSGGEVGRGKGQIVSEVEFVPSPKVEMNGVRSSLVNAGLQETGTATLSELSPRLTEDDIQRLFPDNLGDTHQFFIEVQMDARDGLARRRRFTTKGVPQRDMDKFEWRVQLQLQNSERNRDGSLDTPQLYPPRFRG